MPHSANRDRRDSDRLDDRTHDLLVRFLTDVKNLPNEAAKTTRFASLLGQLFSEPAIVTGFAAGVERRVLRIDTAKRSKRGRIDAYYGNAVIEFENSLKATGDHAEDQLRGYVSGIWRKEGQRPLLAIATDGVVWRDYRPTLKGKPKETPSAEDVELEILRELVLSEKTFADFWIWLTSLLYRQSRTDPTVEQFRVDFGAASMAFGDGLDALKQAWLLGRRYSEPHIAFENWQKYLTVTYGQLPDVSDPDLELLFFKHTYLASVARLLVWASLSKGKIEGSLRDVAREVLSGRFFEAQQLANLVEDDFFQWVRRPEAEKILAPVWERIIVHLLTYDLSRLGEDVLKGVYQELVDPKDRHDLGEYYTPDWLCERIVTTLLPKNGWASVLDPTCGSGSFLRASITHLLSANPDESESAQLHRVLQNVVGIDIHPLAVTIAKATYLLALGPLVKAARRPIQIPVYLADSLFLPTEVRQMTFEDHSFGTELKFGGFKVAVPDKLVENSETFDGAISACARVAADHAKGKRESTETLKAYLLRVLPRLGKWSESEHEEAIEALWQLTMRLSDLIQSKKNSIWAFIIRNTYRPAMLKGHFDVVIGNPPWLSYRYIADPEYQKEVKSRAVDEYHIAPESQKLVTQMELATVFLAHCLTTFGKDGARLGFVMPRSVLSADQHMQLRLRAYSAPFRLTGYWDLCEVSPVFNVPACVLFAKRQTDPGKMRDELPVLDWEGKLDGRDVTWEQAKAQLKTQKSIGRVIYLGDRTAFSTGPGRTEPNDPSPYVNQFHDGATIYPRNFYFVRVRDLDGKPDPEKVYWMETDPAQAEDSKPPYDDVLIRGHVEGRFLYSTAISRHVLPFLVLEPAVIAVPVKRDGATLSVRTADKLQKDGFREMATWMRTVEKIWSEKRGSKAEKQTVYEWLDYQSKLTAQRLSLRYLVLYNASGMHVAAATFDRKSCSLPFIVDHKLYWIGCQSLSEADYLTAILNAQAVNETIKPFQSRGLMGERDVHKKVLDLPIPEYDSHVSLHGTLAELGAQAREQAATLINADEFPTTLGAQRGWLRARLGGLLKEIDQATKKILDLE